MSASPVSKRFGQAVRRRRVEVGMTQEALAERVGIHPTYVGIVERGGRNPTLDVCHRIAGALGLNLSSMLADACERNAKHRSDHE